MLRATLLFVLLSPLSSPLVQAEEDNFRYVMCRNKQIVRTIRAEWHKSTDSCNTLYTKNGKDRSVGTGRFFDSCVKFLENVQGNLEKAGWKCRDISKASITPVENKEN